MINCAAGIDEFMIELPHEEFRNRYCMEMLISELRKSVAEDAILNFVEGVTAPFIEIPWVDVAIGLAAARLDLYEALRLAHDYNMCCNRYIS